MTLDTAAPPNASSQSSVYTDRTNRAAIALWSRYWSRIGRIWYVAALAVLFLLLAAEWPAGVHGHAATTAPRAGIPWIVLLLPGAGVVLIAAVCVQRMRRLRAAMVVLAAQLEQHSGAVPGRSEPLPEMGFPGMDRLVRAINGARRRCAERESEWLTMQASCVHDLRTPLTRMVLRCDLIDDASLRAAMERDLDEMRELAEAGLACARMQSGLAQKLRNVDADGMLATLVQNYRDAGCTLALDGLVGRPVLTCPHALRRILVNLVDNAFRYGNNVRVRVRAEGGRLHLAVLDSGPGIAPAELDAVFMPWYRSAETAARGPGSGLGLAIARRLAQAIRADLALQNRHEGGLEARLSLPL
ncbi:sensor histidine kinase [Cupriavidus pauculus]|uniref:histidine kinase n=1 Tax=Cupriavidus pauculus TaxID=82633 RepID=A0A2N5CF08_9BURK|nr:HAMP domain-containing sensor histidine kinase [Cupriavidus pauculus]PLQ00813.1 histidine kinase [Cupriavidus pauculus]